MRCAYDIKFEMLQVRENEISLRKWSGGTAHAQVVWWHCACASGLVVLRMRTSGRTLNKNVLCCFLSNYFLDFRTDLRPWPNGPFPRSMASCPMSPLTRSSPCNPDSLTLMRSTWVAANSLLSIRHSWSIATCCSTYFRQCCHGQYLQTIIQFWWICAAIYWIRCNFYASGLISNFVITELHIVCSSSEFIISSVVRQTLSMCAGADMLSRCFCQQSLQIQIIKIFKVE